MASFALWLEVLSWTKALFEAVTLGADVREQVRKHRQEKDTIAEAQRASVAFSTYSDAEVEAILNRLKHCEADFIATTDGAARHRCLCHVFAQIIAGNGGTLPIIDDWQNIFRTLNCPKR